MRYLQPICQCLLACALLMSSTAYSDGSEAHSVQVHHPRVHPTVEGIKVTGVYFDLFNGKHEDLKLIKVTGDISSRIEVHEHAMKDGLMRMQEVNEGIDLPAGKMVVFKPHGYHVMVMDLEKVINEGDEIDLELHFDNGESKKISVTALKPSKQQHSHHKY